jgi:acyl-CoA thioester hydrolase
MRPPVRKVRPPRAVGASGAETPAVYSMPVRVYYQDTDAGGVMFHANYLHFFERARTEWLRQLGFDVRGLAETHGLLFIVRELRMNFLRPALVDDLLAVTAVIDNLGRAQFTLGQCVLRGKELLVQGSVNLACVTVHGLGPVGLPPDVYTVLERCAGRAVTQEEGA